MSVEDNLNIKTGSMMYKRAEVSEEKREIQGRRVYLTNNHNNRKAIAVGG